jgi:3-oxoacyl-[acyl-carrier-protein] synthase II
MSRRVVITGMGTVTPHADDVDRLFAQLCEGVSAVGRITRFDPAGMPSQVAAEVKYEVLAPERAGPYDLRPRAMRFAWRAAEKALQDAGLHAPDPDDHAARARRAVHLTVGVGSTALEALGPLMLRAWGTPTDGAAAGSSTGPSAGPPSGPPPEPDLPAFRRAAGADPEAIRPIEDWFIDQAAAALGLQFGAARVATAASACASGSHAILDAMNLVRLGHADAVLCGGVCTPITRSMMPGFALLSALTTGRNDEPAAASRPFDAGRDGFIMAEGCSLLVLEDLDSARRRGARIYAELLGAGIASDSYRLTDPEPTGRGMRTAMQRALADAGLGADAVDYVNAHGTSTKMNDAAETRAIKETLGARAYEVPVSSCKSMFGHLIHAAGATEAIVCVKSIHTGVLSPTINQETKDPDCDLDYVPNVAREHKMRIVLKNSFGFGGQNVSLVISAWDGRA